MQHKNHRPHLTLVQPTGSWRHVDEIQTGMAALALAFARELSETNLPTQDDITSALRQPVSLAAALNDLARVLEIAPPELVLTALDDPQSTA